MKKKGLFIIILLIIICIVAFIIIKNNNSQKESSNEVLEYTPEEEISEEQLRETILTLYFQNSETGELKSEGRLINANELVKDPYRQIVQCLIDGPKTNDLQNVFPENTRILEANIENNCVTLNFSEELLNFETDDQKYTIINSILNSLTQLTEVNSIKILINGETAEKLDEEYCVIS